MIHFDSRSGLGILCALGVLSALACSEWKSKGAEVHLLLADAGNKPAAVPLKKAPKKPNARGNVTPPNSAGEMDCIFLNIKGDGVPRNFDVTQFDDNDGGATADCLEFYTVSKTVSVATATSTGVRVQVRPGPNRTIEVLGYTGDLGSACANMTIVELANSEGDGGVFLLGSRQTNISGDLQVSIANTYSTANPDSFDRVAACDSNNGVGPTHVFRFNGGTYTDLSFPSTTQRVNALHYDAGNSLLLAGTDGVDLNGDSQTEYVLAYDGTDWTSMPLGLDAQVRAITNVGGNLYIGGDFTGGLKRYNAGTPSWDLVNSGVVGGAVRALAAGSPGTLYVGGDFTSSGANAAVAKFAKYNEGANLWDSVAPNIGSSATVHALAHQSGQTYIGGDFDDAATVTGADNIVSYNGSTYGQLGSPGDVNGTVRAIHATSTNVYVAGDFTDLAGLAGVDGIGRYEIGVFTWTAMQSGVDGVVNIIKDFGGFPLAVGDFDSASLVSGTRNIARFNAGAWEPLAGGVNGEITAMATYASNVYIAGSFDAVSTASRSTKVRKAFRRARLPRAR